MQQLVNDNQVGCPDSQFRECLAMLGMLFSSAALHALMLLMPWRRGQPLCQDMPMLDGPAGHGFFAE